MIMVSVKEELGKNVVKMNGVGTVPCDIVKTTASHPAESDNQTIPQNVFSQFCISARKHFRGYRGTRPFVSPTEAGTEN